MPKKILYVLDVRLKKIKKNDSLFFAADLDALLPSAAQKRKPADYPPVTIYFSFLCVGFFSRLFGGFARFFSGFFSGFFRRDGERIDGYYAVVNIEK